MARRLKKPKKCRSKTCRAIAETLIGRRNQVENLSSEVIKLQAQLKAKEDWNREELTHMQARTAMIGAMSWALKACSSVMWSEKQVGWTYQTAQPRSR